MITSDILIEKRLELSKQLKELRLPLDQQWHALVDQFMQDNSPVKPNQVYEHLGKRRKRKHETQRFLVEKTTCTILFNDCASIKAVGYRLDDQGQPVGREVYYPVWGISNAESFVLSKNQHFIR